MQKVYELDSAEATQKLGAAIGAALKGGEVLELSGDVGAGKTTLVKGLARGLEISDVVQSPTFTISRVYEAHGGLTLYHYDFYRLNEAGIMRDELAESLHEPSAVVALEWDDTVRDVLPAEKTVTFTFTYSGVTSRQLQVAAPKELTYLLEGISK